MSISTKGKRKLICQNKTYYWYVKPNYDDMWLIGKMLQLHIFSEDLSWQVCFPLDSCLRPEKRDAACTAPVPLPDTVTPEIVRQIIEADQANLNKELK